MHSAPLFVCLLLLTAACVAGAMPEIAPRAPGEPMTLDQLPLLPRGVTTSNFSSHNKKGVNGDADWFLYKDAHGDFVVFDVEGPGCLRSFWMTALSGDQNFKFYFDGEKEPRYIINCLELFQGKHPLFPPPLASYEVTGRYEGDQRSGNCFVPIPFARSLRIAITARTAFYHFYYERYPYGAPIRTYTGQENRDYLRQAFSRQGEELQPKPGAEVTRVAGSMEPNAAMTLLNVEKAATVCRVVVEGDGSDDFLNQVDIQARWDESPRPDVLAPVGMFFGAAVRAEEVKSLPARVEKLPGGRVRLTGYFRMPFWRRGSIVLLNRMARNSGPVSAEVHSVPNVYPERETGYFCALYRDGRTEMARDWLFCDAVGAGWFVGAVQTMFGQHYCEGDEHFTVDGAGMPQVNGTGSEDYYLACFWPNRNFNLPFAGCVGDIFLQPGPACYYRFHLEAPIPFYQSLDARIQHGGASDIVSHYRSCGFYYLRRQPVLRQTDLLDVGNEASEKAHGYRAAKSRLTGDLDAAYEGNAAWTKVRDSGRAHDGGEIRFTLAVAPDNAGVRLRRRLDQNGPRQAAEVYVDDRPAGVWVHPDTNPYLRWYDSDFELPAALTQGKKTLRLRLVVTQGPFTDFRYEAFTYEAPE